MKRSERLATVLVIEDDPMILSNTLEILTLEGFDTIGAENGFEGVLQAQSQLPNIIICDILMPKLDGFGVLKELRSNPLTAKIPFVFVSATLHEELLAASSKLGVSDYLIKPFRAADLVRMIRTLLDQHSGNTGR